MRPPAALLALLCWLVAAQPGRVIDGDTFEAAVLAYPRLVVNERVRVLAVNTPELKGDTVAAGRAAKAFTEAWLAGAGQVTLGIGCGMAPPYDNFGRLLATVARPDGALADALIAAGHGVPMRGR